MLEKVHESEMLSKCVTVLEAHFNLYFFYFYLLYLYFYLFFNNCSLYAPFVSSCKDSFNECFFYRVCFWGCFLLYYSNYQTPNFRHITALNEIVPIFFFIFQRLVLIGWSSSQRFLWNHHKFLTTGLQRRPFCFRYYTGWPLSSSWHSLLLPK